MRRQVGNLVIEDGIARKGILVRHLVLPSNLAGSKQVLGWIKKELGIETFVSLMAQYNPMHKATEYPMLTRGIRQEEYDALLTFLEEEGFEMFSFRNWTVPSFLYQTLNAATHLSRT
jgi:putative pyruvate formate lyase activating enzyme